ncbi:MAG: response regulator [Acetobacteraceae bacterium]|nr:response regulator [Acetobacteraceae bacterium]
MTDLLLIEDDDETVEEVAEYFRTRGYALERAVSGAEGLTRAREGRFDVMVVDRRLPPLDGLSMLAKLRQEGVRTPAIVLSALGGVDERINGLRAPAAADRPSAGPGGQQLSTLPAAAVGPELQDWLPRTCTRCVWRAVRG